MRLALGGVSHQTEGHMGPTFDSWLLSHISGTFYIHSWQGGSPTSCLSTLPPTLNIRLDIYSLEFGLVLVTPVLPGLSCPGCISIQLYPTQLHSLQKTSLNKRCAEESPDLPSNQEVWKQRFSPTCSLLQQFSCWVGRGLGRTVCYLFQWICRKGQENTEVSVAPDRVLMITLTWWQAMALHSDMSLVDNNLAHRKYNHFQNKDRNDSKWQNYVSELWFRGANHAYPYFSLDHSVFVWN